MPQPQQADNPQGPSSSYVRISTDTHKYLRAYAALKGEQMMEVLDKALVEYIRRNPAEGLTMPDEAA